MPFDEVKDYFNPKPVTNFDANIMYSNDYWIKEEKINRVWVRKRDKQQFWRFLENWYDL
jgi:hypothetical protein